MKALVRGIGRLGPVAFASVLGCSTASAPASRESSSAGSCTTPQGLGYRCSGNDSGYVFVPPLPSEDQELGLDGGAGAAASAPDVQYTDEACRSFLDEEVQGLVSHAVTSRTPMITAPTDGAALERDVPVTVSWQKGVGAKKSPLRRLVDALEPSAYAHGSTTGDGYVVEFSQGCSEVLRVMLRDTAWTIDPLSWQRLSALQGPITVRVVWAKYVENSLPTGTTPAVSPPVVFTIAP